MVEEEFGDLKKWIEAGRYPCSVGFGLYANEWRRRWSLFSFYLHKRFAK